MKKIGVEVGKLDPAQFKLLSALAEIFSVQLEEGHFQVDARFDAWILADFGKNDLESIVACKVPVFSVIAEDYWVECRDSTSLKFDKDSVLPAIMRNRIVQSAEISSAKALPDWLSGFQGLAFKSDKPIWSIKQFNGNCHHFVSLKIPAFKEAEALFLHFNGDNFINLLPLLVFFRNLSGADEWLAPALQACFMFDDPNLHWPTYGHIDFKAMAAHARLHGYHASFATIPLDGWFAHKPTTEIFKENTDYLSLLVHGNDHIAEELGQPMLDDDCLRLLSQALHRVVKFEQKYHVPISRVMAPPHGACSEKMIGYMAKLGFEAVCVSGGSLRHYNGSAPWLKTLGMRLCENIAGLPVIPRFRISKDCQNSIIVAALLGQPIIPVGHHQDVAGSLELLAKLAEFINSLGQVSWQDMKGIARSLYSYKLDGNRVLLKIHSNKIDFKIPSDVSQLYLTKSSNCDEAVQHLNFTVLDENKKASMSGGKSSVPVKSGQKLQIAIEQSGQGGFQDIKYRQLKIWPITRRLLTEIRDRIQPKLR